MEASCCKLNIFHYNNIDKYDKLLYLDADVLINGDVNQLFNLDISSNKIYALEEGHIGHEYWGGQFFNFNVFTKQTSAFSAGVFYFRNSLDIKSLFLDVQNHITTSKLVPVCLDQPFLVYQSFIQNKYDNQMMKTYLENNPKDVNLEKIIYHFPGGPGDYESKYDKMMSFFNKISIRIFEDRKVMLKYYCNLLTRPKLLEIGIFKGEFLDYIVRECNIGSIDGVDLFSGMTCSGDADGNNLIHYDVGKSYLELTEKYVNTKHVKVYMADSTIFLKCIDDDLYDIIYIDGDHTYNGVKKDLMNSFKKIKNGGYIMGHDYEMNMEKAKTIYDFGVKKAVDEFCIKYNQRIIAKGMDGCVSYCIRVSK